MINLNYTRQSTKELFEKFHSNLIFSSDSLSYTLVKDALVLPSAIIQDRLNVQGGVFTKDREFIESSGYHVGVGGYYDYDKSQEVVVNDEAIFISWVPEAWGHSFTDCIKKIWFLSTPEGKEMIADGVKIVFISDRCKMPYNNIIEIFKFFDVDLESCILIDKPTVIKSLVVPEDSLRGDYVKKVYYQEYIDSVGLLRSRLYGKLNETPMNMELPRKIYFSRQCFNNRRIREFGEKGIERAFSKMGYRIYFPEKLSLLEQVNLLRNCSHFATTEGSIAHNAIFCQKDSYIDIVRKANYVNLYQLLINDVVGLNLTYIDAHNSPPTWTGMEYWGPFFLSVNKYLEEFAGRRFFFLNRPYWLRYKWWYQKYYNRKIVKRFRDFLMHIGVDINPFWWNN